MRVKLIGAIVTAFVVLFGAPATASPAAAEADRARSAPVDYVFAHRVAPGHWTGQCEVGRDFLTLDVYTADWYDLPVPYEAVADYYSGAVGNFDDPGYPQGSILIEQYNWEYDTGHPYPPFETPYTIHSDEYGLINAHLNGGSSGGGPTLFAGRWTNTELDLDVVGHQLVTFLPDSGLKCYIVFAWGYERYWQ